MIRKAKKKKQAVSLAFCDLAKAYDSVDRSLMYLKLRSVGLGGKELKLIQSMYFNDCVQVRIQEGLSAPLWFEKGVKQGCSLSPLLFSLYMAGLGQALHESRLGIRMGRQYVSALFFADDLVLVSRSRRTGMESLIDIVVNFCKDMKMKLSPTKTFIITNKSTGQPWMVDDQALEEVLVAKYLGVNIQVQGRSLVGQYERTMLSRARTFSHTIMGLSKSGLDRASVARTLWEGCAIPAVLYCCESFAPTAKTIRELEAVQNAVARFILQVPQCTSRVSGWMDAGLRPMAARIQSRQASYAWDISNKREDPLLENAITEVRLLEGDRWVQAIAKIEEAIGPIADFTSKKALKKAMDDAAIQTVIDVKQDHPTMRAASQPETWFKLQRHVNDSHASKSLCRARTGTMGLGNRFRNEFGEKYEECPACRLVGRSCELWEGHVVFSCPIVRQLRRHLRVREYKKEAEKRGFIEEEMLMHSYLGDDGSCHQDLLRRGSIVQRLVDAWMSQIHE